MAVGQKKELNDLKCAFCLSAENNWVELGYKKDLQNVVTHYYCLLLSSEMEQKGEDSDGILGFLLPDIKKEIARGKKQKCFHCNKHGATVRCVVPKCKKNFHLPCGIRNKSLHQFYGHFKSFCGAHRPTQKIPANLLAQLAAGLPCAICLEELPKAMGGDTVWAPCCRKGAWFHRPCVQRLAISAGYFFKCPLCNDKEKFNKTMQACGIFIPEQDASWETEPHAFEELLHRHSTCDHPACRDPLGRTNNVSGTRWEVVLCDLCGSQGVHMACGQLSWNNPEFECDICVGSRAHAAASEGADAPLQPTEGTESDASDQDSQESRPLSLSTSPLPDLRVDSPDLFPKLEAPAANPMRHSPREGQTTTPPLAPPSISGPFPRQPGRPRLNRGRPPLKKVLPASAPVILPPDPSVATPPPISSTENVFIALQHPTPPPLPRAITPGKYDFYDPNATAASSSNVLSNFTVVGSHVFQPKSFSDSVSITPPPPPPPPPVRELNQSPSKVSTTARSTLFPQSQSRVAPAPVPHPAVADVIDLSDDSDDDDIEIIEDKRSSVKELVTRDGAKIPVVKVPLTAPPKPAPANPEDRGSPDLEIIEVTSSSRNKPTPVYVRREAPSARSQENLSPLRLALELPLVAGQPVPASPQAKPGFGRMLAPRRIRPIQPTWQTTGQKAQPRHALGNQTQSSNGPQVSGDGQTAKASLPSGQAPAIDPGRLANSAKYRRAPHEGNPPETLQSGWQTQTGQSPKRIRVQSPNAGHVMAGSRRRSTDPPSYEETMKNDKTQALNVNAAGSATAGSYFITDPTSSFRNLVDANLFTWFSRSTTHPGVSSFMLTPVPSAFVRTGTPQQSVSVGGNDPGSQRRRLECDPGGAANSNAAHQTASAACARSERHTIGTARQGSASKAVGSPDLPRCDRNRLINLRTTSFKMVLPDLVKMTGYSKEILIPITSPDKKILIPVKPTEFCDESIVPVHLKLQLTHKPKLKRAKRGAAFARPTDPAKPRKRRSMWSKGLIKPLSKKKVPVVSTASESASSSKLAPRDSASCSALSIVEGSSTSELAEASSTKEQSALTKSHDSPVRLSVTTKKSSPAKLTHASPATRNSAANRHSAACGIDIRATNAVKKQLFTSDSPILSTKSPVEKSDLISPKKGLCTSERPEKGGRYKIEECSTGSDDMAYEGASGSPESLAANEQTRLKSIYLNYRRKNIDAVAISSQGQSLTRRTRSLMKAASLSTRSKVSLQKYNFKRGSNNYVPLLRKGYIPKNMQSTGVVPKVSTSVAPCLETEVSQSSSSGEFSIIDFDSQKLEAKSKVEEQSSVDIVFSSSNKITNCKDHNVNSTDFVRPNFQEGLPEQLPRCAFDYLISEDEDFYLSQDDADNVDDEDDTVFIQRTMKEYQKLHQISTVKAKALTARKFRPASDTENMQREMLLKLREMPSTISHPP